MDDKTTPKKTILIVEDELPFRQIYRDALHMHGYNVVEAEDGQEALKIIEEKLPDLVLLDLVLPKLSGFDVLTHLKNAPQLKTIPVVVYSILNDQSNIDRAMKLGADDFTIKGETPAVDVVSKVRELLGEI